MLSTSDDLDPITIRIIVERLIDLAGDATSFEKTNNRRHTPDYLLTETQDANFAEFARCLYMLRAERRRFLPNDLFGEPAWDMLLDLYVQKLTGVKVPITSAAIASHTALTTALRYMKQLVNLGFATRTPSRRDRRVNFFELTDKGEAEVTRYLTALSRSLHFKKAIGLGNRFRALDSVSQTESSAYGH